MEKKGFLFLGIFLALLLLLAGCAEINSPKPATVYYAPTQCRTNPWEQWYDSGAVNYVKAPTDEELIKDYYSQVEKIEVVQVEIIRGPAGGVVCKACQCARGDTIRMVIAEKDKARMLSLGWRETQKPQPPEPPKEVSVSTDKYSYVIGEKIIVSVANNSNEDIFLPGCNHYTIGSATDCMPEADCIEDDWAEVNQKQCVWEGFAVKIAKGETKTFEETVMESWGLGGLKARLDYSVGCTEGEPLSQANCRAGNTVYSKEFEIVQTMRAYDDSDEYRITVTPS